MKIWRQCSLSWWGNWITTEQQLAGAISDILLQVFRNAKWAWWWD